MIFIKKIILLFSLFFLFNTLEVNSNSNKNLFYDRVNIYEENYHVIYFNNVNSIDLENALEKLNINVLSYIIDDKKYYANDINELVNKYINNLELDEKIFYEKNGIIIDGISVICQNSELLKLEGMVGVY